MAIYKQEDNQFTQFKGIKIFNSDGTYKDIKSVFTYDTNTSTKNEIYPNKATRLHLTSNLDNDATYKATEDNTYGWPVLSYKTTSINITCLPFPLNSGWYVTSDDLTLTNEGASNIHYGEGSISISYVDPEENGYYLKTLVFHNTRDDYTEVFKVWFYKTDVEEVVVNSKYMWTFDNEVTDSVTNRATFSRVGGTAPAFTTGKNGYALTNELISTDSSATANCYVIDNLEFNTQDTGGSIEFWIKFTYNNNLFVGFKAEDDTSAGETISWSKNGIGVTFSYAQPMARLANQGNVGLKPTALGRISKNTWHHIALTWSKAYTNTTLAQVPGVVVNDDESYTWTSLNFPDSSKLTVAAKNLPKSFYTYVACYIDGTVSQDALVPIALVDINNIGYGVSGFDPYNLKYNLNNLGNNRFVIQLNNPSTNNSTLLDNLKIFDRERTAAEILLEVGSELAQTEVEQSVPAWSRTTPTDTPAFNFHLKPFIIDQNTIAVATDISPFLEDRIAAEYGACISPMEQNYCNGFLKESQKWQLVRRYKYAVIDILNNYFATIKTAWNDPSNITVNNQATTIKGQWLNSSEQLAVKGVYDNTLVHNALSLAQYNFITYISLPSAMVQGTTYEIKDSFGNTTSFVNNSDQYAASIKVNQEGYLPYCEKKYAYYGWWLGTGGYYPAADANVTFNVVNVATNETVYTGTATRVNPDNDVSFNFNLGGTHKYIVTGENTFLIDFSSVTAEGEYRIFIPTVGYSHKFKISNRAWDKALWTYMRGMFLQRSGIAKTEEYTKWIYPQPDHVWSWKSKFCGNLNDAQNIKNDAGESFISNVSLTNYSNANFALVGMYQDNIPYREIKGGWFDAADFDRRPFHMLCVQNMLEAYQLAPENFTDSQFDIPESGDGIPDLLSEAIWGLNYMRISQSDEGGISAWIESDGHENDWPWLSKRKYYQAPYNRADTIRYAWLAATLARFLFDLNTEASIKKAIIWSESATRAYKWAMNEENTCKFTINYEGDDYNYTETLAYTRSDEDPDRKGINNTFGDFAFKASCAMYMLNKDKAYINDARNNYELYKTWLEYDNTSDAYGSTICITLLFDLKNILPDLYDKHVAFLKSRCEKWYGYQQTHRYKMMTWPEGPEGTASKYFLSQAWGKVHPETRASNFVIYWKLLKKLNNDAETVESKKYRDAAINAMDWAMGCNEQGRSLTSGLGVVYPVTCLDHFQLRSRMENGYYELRPGITPYAYIGLNKLAISTAYRLNLSKYSGAGITYPAFTLNLLPGEAGEIKDASALVNYIADTQPIQRQYCELGAYTVSQSEFTISETIAGKIFMAGVLMPSGYINNSSWKQRTPIVNKFDCPGYQYLT